MLNKELLKFGGEVNNASKNNNIHLPVVVHGPNYLSVLKLPIYNNNIT